jgi:hypothetical protein
MPYDSFNSNGDLMPDLSPAAQQVFWEFNRAASGKPDDWYYLPAIAAALRAAADQVAPYETEIIDNCYYEARNPVREQLLAIAAELDGSVTP